ncbi:hypothetical protein [uncultured Ruthenibacterium sp.]|uniref:hypothetical protein n=1 Tax=uncultured Ruthenibacterium sp. TaxID=1905347 RepID=UPI00349EDD1E
MELRKDIDRKRRLVRILRRCTPPTDKEFARRCPRTHCPWRRDGAQVCVLACCMNKGGV